MQARGGLFKAIEPPLAGKLLDGAAAGLDGLKLLEDIPVFGVCAMALTVLITVAKDFKDNEELV
ncbi:hypothetical protein HDU93_009109, partial [Gonapodya sp. JEL0774]